MFPSWYKTSREYCVREEQQFFSTQSHNNVCEGIGTHKKVIFIPFKSLCYSFILSSISIMPFLQGRYGKDEVKYELEWKLHSDRVQWKIGRLEWQHYVGKSKLAHGGCRWEIEIDGMGKFTLRMMWYLFWICDVL